MTKVKGQPRPWLRRILWGLGVLSALVILAGTVLAIFVALIDNEITIKFEQLRSTRSSTFYAMFPDLKPGQLYQREAIDKLFSEMGYVEVRSEPTEGTYRWEPSMTASYLRSVTLFRPRFSGAGHPIEARKINLLFETTEAKDFLKLSEIVTSDTRENLSRLENPPKRLGFFFAGRMRTQHSVPISEIPVALRLAVMGIEDSSFLEHHGMSLKGTLRALYKDIIALKFVQGGSTITQQLMKILFFSHEKVIKRKLMEALYAFVAEARHSKEDILEAYLNEVYLGQWNGHEIHGVSEAARYYFGKPVTDLSLAESAVLAGIIQRPNYFNPRKKPEKTLARRNQVLKRMLKENFILPEEYEKATQEPIVVGNVDRTLDDAAYFMELAMQSLPKEHRESLDTQALTIYVPLNPYLQTIAKESLSGHITKLEEWYKTLKEKKEEGKDLQGALIAVDPKTCHVLALQGGTSFRETQFNRVLQGKRQPGSLFKPYVFLAAFEHLRGPEAITPITNVADTEFVWKYEGQQWSPKNYDEEYRDFVTVRQALERSINIPTARIAEKVGIKKVRQAMLEAGIHSRLPRVPSLSLGSAEVTPLELAESYTTMANLGQFCSLRSYLEVYDENRNLVTENKLQRERRLPAAPVFQTLQLMKGVFVSGTATLAQNKGIPTENFAGKTGTTNDYKDAWFIGFSPELLVLIWVGYDEKDTSGLTGSAAALPVWIEFMKKARPFYSDEDFETPEGLSYLQVDTEKKCRAKPGSENARWEYFVSGTEPEAKCSN